MNRIGAAVLGACRPDGGDGCLWPSAELGDSERM
jgi:hypothetical protein